MAYSDLDDVDYLVEDNAMYDFSNWGEAQQKRMSPLFEKL